MKFRTILSTLAALASLAGCLDDRPVGPPQDPDAHLAGEAPPRRIPAEPGSGPYGSEDCGTSKGAIPASNPCIRYLGRVDASDPETVRFDWPGTVIEARFQGSQVKALINAAGVRFDVYIDNVKVPPKADALGKASLFVTAGQTEYALAEGLPAGEHSLRIEKRSETLFMAVEFMGLTLDAGATLKALPARSERRIEFIGDSYTAGYGNESPSKTSPTRQDASGRECSNDELVAHTNTQATYAVLAAKALGAEYQVNAFSGLGMARHYNGSTAFLPFSEYYRKALISVPGGPDYDSKGWVPQVVLIGLGTNDFSTPLGAAEAAAYPTRQALYQAYQDRYRDFLKSLRARYPGVKFILMATNLWPDDEMKAQVKQVIANEKILGNTDLAYFELLNLTGYGCGWHPDLGTHSQHSRQLTQMVTQLTGWNPANTSIRR